MDQFCPLCQKSGNKKRIKAVQINYEEALKLCESETCPWPFGYEDLEYIPQKADFLNMQPEKVNEKKSIDISELTMYTPPLTPKGECFASTTTSSNSDVVNCTSTLNNCIKEDIDIDKDQTVAQNYTILQSIFDIDTKKNNISLDTKNQVKILDHLTNNVKSKEPRKDHLRIRSVERVHVQIKPNNYFHIISGKHNTKPPLKKISNQELNNTVPIKNGTQSCKSVIKSETSQSYTENDLNRQNLSLQSIEHSEYNQIDTRPSNKFVADNQSEKQLNNNNNTLEHIINNDEHMSPVQNTKPPASDQPDMSSVSPISIDNFFDEMFLNELNSHQLTENIDDDWLKSLI